MKRIKTWDELSIRDNYMFQKVMRTEPDLLQRLLEHLLRFSIHRIDFPQTEKVIGTGLRSKSVRLDVYAEDDEGRVYDIEMHASDMVDDELSLRTRYYQSMIDQGILEKGRSYSELRESFVIFTCAFDPFGRGLLRYTFRARCDQCLELALPDRATRIFLNAMGTTGDESPEIRGFLEYIKTNKAPEGFASEVARLVERVKADGKEKEIYMSQAMDMQMYVEKEMAHWRAEGKAEGMAKGKAEGLAEGSNKERISLITNMLFSGMNPEQISFATKVPLDEICSVQARLAKSQ